MALPDMLIPQPNETEEQAGRRRVANALIQQPIDYGTMPSRPMQPASGLLPSTFGRLGGGMAGGSVPTQAAPVGGSYARPMDPHTASLAKGQRSIDAQRQALAASQPQNLGQGIAMAGEAFNLAMRQRAQNQAAADPWSGMRETTTGGAGGGFDLGGALKRIFG